jgi:hypothetical protein
VLAGPSGTGKTTSARHFLAQLRANSSLPSYLWLWTGRVVQHTRVFCRSASAQNPLDPSRDIFFRARFTYVCHVDARWRTWLGLTTSLRTSPSTSAAPLVNAAAQQLCNCRRGLRLVPDHSGAPHAQGQEFEGPIVRQRYMLVPCTHTLCSSSVLLYMKMFVRVGRVDVKIKVLAKLAHTACSE